MIAKISHGCNVASLIEYHEQKISKGTATLLHAERFLLPNKLLYKSVFEQYISDTRMENPTFHASLNLPPGEKIDANQFKVIAKDYMEGLGYGNQPYVIYHHTDRNHDHIHIISVNIQEDGKRIETFYQHNKSQDLTRELETKYNLKVVSSKKLTERETEEKADLSKSSGIRSFVGRQNKAVLQNYHPASFTEYKKMLSLHNVKLEQVPDHNGEKFGYVFQIKDQPDTVKIKGSDLYYRFNDKVLDRKYSKSSTIKSAYNIRPLSNLIFKCLRNYDQIHYEDFATRLKENHIDVVYDRYKDGRIYGVSFLDHNAGVILKGSEVNRNYTIGKLKDVLCDNVTKKKVSSLLYDAYFEKYTEYRNENFNVDQLKFINQGEPSKAILNWMDEHHPDRVGEANTLITGFLANRKKAVEENLEKLKKLKVFNTKLETVFKESYSTAVRKDLVGSKLEYIDKLFENDYPQIREQVLSDVKVKPILSQFTEKEVNKQFDLFKERKQKDRHKIDFNDSLHSKTKEILNHLCPANKEHNNKEVFQALTANDDHTIKGLLKESCNMAIRSFCNNDIGSTVLPSSEIDAILKRHTSFLYDMIVKRYAEATVREQVNAAIKDDFKASKEAHKEAQTKQPGQGKLKYSTYLANIAASPGQLTNDITTGPQLSELDLKGFLKQDLSKTVETLIRGKAKVVPLIRMQEDLSEALREEAKNLTESEKVKIGDVFSDKIYMDILSQAMIDRARMHNDYANAVESLGVESVDRSLRLFLTKNIESLANWYKEYVPFIPYPKQNVFTGLINDVLAEIGQARGSRVGKNTSRNDMKKRKPKL